MNRRMVLAENLKLRKSRGTTIAAVLMTLGIGVLVSVIPEIYHLARPATSYVGGQRGLQRDAVAVGFLGTIAAMIVGTTAGTGDIASGVFRDLVATGRGRWALFSARIPGALLFWVPLVTFAWVVTSLLDTWFSRPGVAHCLGGPGLAGSCGYLAGTVPPAGQFVTWYLWVLLYTCFVLLVAIGLASWVGSRAITLGILIPFQLFVAPILSNITQLAGFRQIFYPQSIGRIAPSYGPGGGARHVFGVLVTHSLLMAWLVLVVWVLAFLAAGLWRTVTRDT